jgi:uncharacterized membrane protein YidH (DUF202 family)
MTPIRVLAVILIVTGALGLAYGGFTYTRNSEQLKLGPVELSVKQTKTVNVPIWLGLGAIVAGAALLALRK